MKRKHEDNEGLSSESRNIKKRNDIELDTISTKEQLLGDNEIIEDKEEELIQLYSNRISYEGKNTDTSTWNRLHFLISDISEFNIFFPPVGNIEFNACYDKYWYFSKWTGNGEIYWLMQKW